MEQLGLFKKGRWDERRELLTRVQLYHIPDFMKTAEDFVTAYKRYAIKCGVHCKICEKIAKRLEIDLY